jgi:hypothetical protein
MSDPNAGATTAAELAEIKKALKESGFSTIGELVKEYQTVRAGLKDAEEARDRFNSANDDARKIIRGKDGEIGGLMQKVTKLEAEIEDLKKAQGEPQGSIAGAPASTPTPVQPTQPAPSPEEELSTLEASLAGDPAYTQRADELLQVMTDEEAAQYAPGGPKRLEFLRGLAKDPSVKKTVVRPKTLMPGAAPSAPDTPPKEDVYAEMVKRLGKTPPGPGGSAGVRRTGAPSGQDKRPRVNWAHSA